MELKDRIIARGEFSDHCHVVTGNCTIERKDDAIYINTEDSSCVMKHLLESKFLQGQEVWTGEHNDIVISDEAIQKSGGLIRHGDVLLKRESKNRYKYIPQLEFDPFEETISTVKD